MTRPTPGITPEVLAAVAAAGDMLQTIAEVVLGYRRKLVEGGVAPEMADVMTKQLHDVLLTKMAG